MSEIELGLINILRERVKRWNAPLVHVDIAGVLTDVLMWFEYHFVLCTSRIDIYICIKTRTRNKARDWELQDLEEMIPKFLYLFWHCQSKHKPLIDIERDFCIVLGGTELSAELGGNKSTYVIYFSSWIIIWRGRAWWFISEDTLRYCRYTLYTIKIMKYLKYEKYWILLTLLTVTVTSKRKRFGRDRDTNRNHTYYHSFEVWRTKVHKRTLINHFHSQC